MKSFVTFNFVIAVTGVKIKIESAAVPDQAKSKARLGGWLAPGSNGHEALYEQPFTLFWKGRRRRT